MGAVKRTNYYLDLWDRNEWRLPVIPLNPMLNPFAGDRVEMSLIAGNFLPYESMKSLAALALLQYGKENGLIEPGVTTVVEATSGATGLALAHFALSNRFAARGVVLVMNDDVPLGKSAPPRFAGAQIIPREKGIPPEKGLSTVETARKMGTWEGYWHPDQYANIAQTKLYKSWAVPHILRQVPYPTVLVTPVGTGGTAIGLGNGFREALPRIAVVGARCAPGVELPGMRDLKGMRDIKLPWESAVDECVEVEREPSYLAAAWFQWAQSFMGGLTGGGTYIAALLALKKRKDNKTLDEWRDRTGVIRILIVCHDGARPYLVDRFPMLHHDHQDPLTAPKPWELLWEK
jgi:cysteine synthase A